MTYSSCFYHIQSTLQIRIFCLWWFSFLLTNLCLVVICLFVCSQWLAVAGYYYYCCLSSNNQWWQCTKVEAAGGLSFNLPLGSRDGQLFRHNTYVYFLYFRHEDDILVTLYTSLPMYHYHSVKSTAFVPTLASISIYCHAKVEIKCCRF